MKLLVNATLTAFAAIWVVAGTPPAAAAQTSSSIDLIERAVSAGPMSIRAAAQVVSFDMQGHPTVLRTGSNGWTCLPYDVGTPTQSPLCLDGAGLAWYTAVMQGKEPDPTVAGLSYMLVGGSVWSNLNPAATKPEHGETSYVSVPPHIMILSAKLAAQSGLPSGQTRPDTSRPFVLLGGTPFAAIILPIGS